HRPEIDEDVAATDEVQAGEGRVLSQVLFGEDAHGPDGLAHLVAAGHLAEKAPQPVRGNVRGNGFRIDAQAGLVNHPVFDIGGEDLDLDVADHVPQEFQEADGQGVGLLPAGAAWYPDADGLILDPVPQDFREDDFLQELKGLRLPEETGDIDQDVFVEVLNFVRMLPQIFYIVLDLFHLLQYHTPVEAPFDGALLVMGKIEAGARL